MKKSFLLLALVALLSIPTTAVVYAADTSELLQLSKKMVRDYDDVENQTLIFVKSRPWFLTLSFESAYEPGLGLLIRQDQNSIKELRAFINIFRYEHPDRTERLTINIDGEAIKIENIKSNGSEYFANTPPVFPLLWTIQKIFREEVFMPNTGNIDPITLCLKIANSKKTVIRLHGYIQNLDFPVKKAQKMAMLDTIRYFELMGGYHSTIQNVASLKEKDIAPKGVDIGLKIENGIAYVSDGGLAKEAGILDGSLILEINGKSAEKIANLLPHIEETVSRGKSMVLLCEKDGEKYVVSLKLKK